MDEKLIEALIAISESLTDIAEAIRESD